MPNKHLYTSYQDGKTMVKRPAVITVGVLICGTLISVLLFSRHTNLPSGNITFTGTAAGEAPTSTQNYDANTFTTELKKQSADSAIQQGNFTISSTQQPVPHWYVLTLSVADMPYSKPQAVFKVTGSGLQLVVDPGATTSPSDLISNGVPQEVQDILGASND